MPAAGLGAEREFYHPRWQFLKIPYWVLSAAFSLHPSLEPMSVRIARFSDFYRVLLLLKKVGLLLGSTQMR